MKILGVLAIQGAYTQHIQHFNKVIEKLNITDLKVIKVSSDEHLQQCDALVIPGGESSTISLVAEKTGLLEPLRNFVNDTTKPVWGTCAGLILLATKITNGIESQDSLGALDIEVERNAFGRQLESFITKLDLTSFISGCDDFQTVFIRAPIVTKVNISCKDKVKILSQLDSGLIVSVRQGNKLGTSFHPELSNDTRFHQWFLEEFVLNS